MKKLQLIILSVFFFQNVFSQEKFIYKTIDTISLSMEIYYPKNLDPSKKYPAMVFFFGGGWNSGSTSQFEPHAKYFSERGLICILPDYRVKNRQGASPFESVEDAKSAIRYLRKNAENLHIDPERIIASGGSAGGHLAAATATVEKYNDKNDDLTISPVPNALVLFNPVIDNGPGGYGYERIGDEYRYFSPLHNIQKGTPPTIIFLGTKDHLIPIETVQYYKMVMEKTGNRCDLQLYEGEGHGFFNSKNTDNYKNTVLKADEFLVSLGYLSGSPTVKP